MDGFHETDGWMTDSIRQSFRQNLSERWMDGQIPSDGWMDSIRWMDGHLPSDGLHQIQTYIDR